MILSSFFTSTITLTRVLALRGGANHFPGDSIPVRPPALLIGQDVQVDLLQDVGLLAIRGQLAPTGYGGCATDKVLCIIFGQAGGGDALAERLTLAKLEQGKVVGGRRACLVSRVHDDLLHLDESLNSRNLCRKRYHEMDEKRF